MSQALEVSRSLGLVRDYIGRGEALYTLQLDGRLSAIYADIRVAPMRRDIMMRLQVGEGMSLDIQLIARDKVGDDVLTALLAGQEFEDVMVAGAAHCVVAGAPDEGVAARAAFHDGRAGAAEELRVRRATDQGRAAADRVDQVARIRDVELAALDGGAEEGAMHGGAACLLDRVVTKTEGDRVMAVRAGFSDFG